MLYTELTKRAMMICYEAHQGQTDGSDMPYVFHPLHLAEQMETESEICAALLHDVPEDTERTLRDLEDAGFPEEITEAIAKLTHDRSQPYMEYVLGIRDNTIARKVKLADLAHNSDLSRLNEVSSCDRKRRRKYQIAKVLLEESVDDPVSGGSYRDLPIHDKNPWFLRIRYADDGTVSGSEIIDHEAIVYRPDIDSHQLLYGLSEEGRVTSFPEQAAEYLEDHNLDELEKWLEGLGIFCERA